MGLLQVPLTNLIAPSFYTLHNDLKSDKWQEVWLKGGRGSTKSTFASIEIILGLLKDKESNAVILRRYSNELRDTVFGQISWSIMRMELEDKFKFQYAPMQIVYLPTGQKILFKGTDNPRKLRSIILSRGYVKYVWFEELDQHAGMDEIRNILQSLFRGQDASRIAFFSFNPPISGRSWVNQEWKIPKPGRLVHHSDYRKVSHTWLGDRFLIEATHLKSTNEHAYRHEYLGEEVGTGLEVFNNIQLRQISDSEIQTFDQIRQGLDWGYAGHPLAFLRMYYDRKRRSVYIFHEISGLGISNRKIAEQIQPFRNFMTFADSSEPKSIDEVRSYSVKIMKVEKPPGSIETGIRFLQDMEQIVIDPVRCPFTQKQFVNYALEQTRDGIIINKFPDKDDDAIDCVRYALWNDIPRPQQQQQVSIGKSIGLGGVRI